MLFHEYHYFIDSAKIAQNTEYVSIFWQLTLSLKN